MSLGQKVRHYWHELYYAVAGGKGIRFAMRCKDVAERIDLENHSDGIGSRLRFLLHLSLCQSCANYALISRALKRAVQELVAKSGDPARMERLKSELIKRHRPH